MIETITINKLSEQVGLTSRTLRHWESEGLFKSERDIDSGWRSYDQGAVLRIKLTALLRKLDVSIKEIKIIFDNNTFEKLYEVVCSKITALSAQKVEMMQKEERLKLFLPYLQEQSGVFLTDENLSAVLTNLTPYKNSPCEMEAFRMSAINNDSSSLRFITLQPMRVVYNIAVSVSPEDEAMIPVIEWLKIKNLLGISRLFGGNMKPMPSGNNKPYGYGMCASIPYSVVVPSHLKEMMLPGGIYAMLESTDDIGGSWKTLMHYLSENNKYTADKSKLCFEEHIRNDNPEGSGIEYFLNLLQPVKLK